MLEHCQFFFNSLNFEAIFSWFHELWGKIYALKNIFSSSQALVCSFEIVQKSRKFWFASFFEGYKEIVGILEMGLEYLLQDLIFGRSIDKVVQKWGVVSKMRWSGENNFWKILKLLQLLWSSEIGENF